MRVRVKKSFRSIGYFDHQKRKPGDVFEIPDTMFTGPDDPRLANHRPEVREEKAKYPIHFSPVWMEKVTQKPVMVEQAAEPEEEKADKDESPL